ncbi:hypothetical protein C8F01DRAFT_1292717 [Mycena amicta]|nr:hypothetical protein C8F01DRAFT_1292717 [Mycena amicta]
MNKMWRPGATFKTTKHPDGVLSKSQILPLLADLGAIQKIAGYLSHSANLFCSFCTLSKDDLDDLDWTSWILHQTDQVREDAQAWREERRWGVKEKETGVRWTPMHDLQGWDPVLHVILGWMHNWLEGILNHHLRVRWGIGRQAYKKELALRREQEEQEDDVYSESDVSEASDILATMRDIDEDIPADDTVEYDHADSDSSPAPAPGTILEGDLDDDMDEDEDDFLPDPPASEHVFSFLKGELQFIRDGIRDVKLPTHVDRPPTNLGEASHGKLKADTVLILFSVIFPLIIPQLWWGKAPKLLINSRIIIFTTVSHSNFCSHFFPDIPNHPYAMHYAALMKFWGPMAALSKFAGERMNGIFGKAKTNGHIYDMTLTMLKRICCLGRLGSFLTQNGRTNTPIGQLANILQFCSPSVNDDVLRQLTDQEVADSIADGSQLSEADFTMLIQYLHSVGQMWRSYREWPHPAGANVLHNAAHVVSDFKFDDKDFTCKEKNEGNSAIQFKNPTAETDLLTGYIDAIWRLPLGSFMQTFICIQLYRRLPANLEARAPYTEMPGLNSAIFNAADSGEWRIIEPRHITTHLTTVHAEKGTFGINKETLIVCWSLNRGRH